MTVHSLINLSIAKFLEKEEIKQIIHPDIQMLICEYIIEHRNLLEKLTYFSHPHIFYTRKIQQLSELNENISYSKIVALLLSAFPNLKSLDLGYVSLRVRPMSLEGLFSDKLEELRFGSGHQALPALEWPMIKDKFPNLQVLDISLCKEITSLEGLPPKLKVLNLAGCKNIPAEEFPKIKDKCSGLKKIILGWNKIEGLKALQGLPLEELEVQGSGSIPQEDWLTIKNTCPHLKKVTFYLYHLENFAGLFAGLAELPIEELVFKSCRTLPIAELQRLPNLKRFIFDGEASPYDIQSFKGWPPQLEELNLFNCRISAAAFLTIKDQFPHLKKLIIPVNNIATWKGSAGLPIEELDLGWNIDIPKEEFMTIKDQFPHLKKLIIPDATWKESIGLPIEESDLGWNTYIPKEEFMTIKDQFPHLKKWTVRGEIQIAALERLAGLPLEEIIIIKGGRISKKAEKQIALFKETHPLVKISTYSFDQNS